MRDVAALRRPNLDSTTSELRNRALGGTVQHPGLIRSCAPHDGESTRLVLSDLLMFAGLAFAFFMAVDPFNWHLGRIAAIKHLSLALVSSSVLLIRFGQGIFAASHQLRSAAIASAALPLILLALFIIAGSLYARTSGQTANTFLTFGLYILVAPGLAYWVYTSKAPAHLVRVYFALAFIASIVMVLLLVVQFGTRGKFHEQEFIFVPMVVFFLALRKWHFLRLTAVAICFLATWLVHKNTGYIILLMGLVYSAWHGPITRISARTPVARFFAWYLVALVAAILLLSIIGTWMFRDVLLPSGNPQFRLLTYARAWNEFLSSPLWGSAFTEAAARKFEGFDTGVARNILPSHSDILDLLAGGGAIGLGLWLWGLCRVARLVRRELFEATYALSEIMPQVHWLSVTSLGAIVTYAFNPIMLQPALALIAWTNLGLLMGLACRSRRDREIMKWRCH